MGPVRRELFAVLESWLSQQLGLSTVPTVARAAACRARTTSDRAGDRPESGGAS
jgi:hypothetical protein